VDGNVVYLVPSYLSSLSDKGYYRVALQ
jgi:hypothetical protein